MVFVRIKKIKQYEYAYLVENSWKKKTSRQKVKEYLGKVIKIDEADVKFDKNIRKDDYKTAVQKILDWQFERWGFECGKTSCKSEDYIYDKSKHTLKTIKHDKPVVVKSHDGYMTKYSIERLFNFEAAGTEEQIAYDLARAFVECGIFVDKDIFIALFQKVYDVKKAMHR